MSSIIPRNPSAEFMRLNPHLFGAPTVVVQRSIVGLSFRITGQIRGGKNNMIVTRTGKHFPKPEWARWRDTTVSELQRQLPAHWKPVAVPMNVRLDYVAGDKRRRDMPAIIDAIWHAMEKAGVVEDDTLLWVSQSSRAYSKESPCAVITFL